MAKRTSVGTEERAIPVESKSKSDPIDAPKHETGTAEPERKTEPVNGIGTIDPFDLPTASDGAGIESPDSQPRRRGRRPGGKNRPKAEVSQDITVNLEELIFGIHEGVAALCAAEEMELDHEESEKLATNFKRVGSLYNKQFNPSTLIWLAFVACLIEVYATRAVAIYKRVTANDTPALPQPAVSRPAPRANGSERPQAQELTPAQIWPIDPIED